MMEQQFQALLELIRQPLNQTGGVRTDNSIRFLYPPERHLDFHEYLLDTFAPLLNAGAIPHRMLDVSGLIFDTLGAREITMLQEDEFDDYRWMKQGLSRRVEASLQKRIAKAAAEAADGTVIVYGTISLYPLIRLGELLKGLRELSCRIVITHPGEIRDGKPWFMDQPDSGNYLTVTLS